MKLSEEEKKMRNARYGKYVPLVLKRRPATEVCEVNRRRCPEMKRVSYIDSRREPNRKIKKEGRRVVRPH